METINPTKKQASSFVSVYKKWGRDEIEKLNQTDRKTIEKMIDFLNSDLLISPKILIDATKPDSIFIASKNLEGNGKTIRLKSIQKLPSKPPTNFIDCIFTNIEEAYSGIGSDSLYNKIQNAHTITSAKDFYLPL